MGERTSHPAGAFSWAELSTDDVDGAKAFYTGLFGWDVEDTPAGPDMNYVMARVGGKEVAAMYQQGEREQGVPPNWHSYVTVASADDAAARARELGAELMGDGAFDVMDVGRMAIVQDPVGATVFVWEPRKSIGATRVNDPGSLTWNDLSTTDPEAAERFYSELFGWEFQKVPGPVDYWTITNGGRANGGMRVQHDQEVADGTPPNWMPYFGVESSESAVAKVGELGGQVIVSTSEVPAGRFTVVRDPQGAVFALFEGDADD
jgi:predicted enzyme related to lactoylglutathione lyase